MVESWKERTLSNDEKFEEAHAQAVSRIAQLVGFLRKAVSINPSMQPLMQIIAGNDFDRELLDAHAAYVIRENGDALKALMLLEQTIARETHINAHEDLAPLMTIINALKPE